MVNAFLKYRSHFFVSPGPACAMCISVQLHCGVTVNEYGYWLCTLLGTTDGTVLRVLCRGTVSQYFQHFFYQKTPPRIRPYMNIQKQFRKDIRINSQKNVCQHNR